MKRVIADTSSSIENDLRKVAALEGFTLEYLGDSISDGIRFTPDSTKRGNFTKFLPTVRLFVHDNTPSVYVDIRCNLTLPAADFESYQLAMRKTGGLVDWLYQEVDWSQM